MFHCALSQERGPSAALKYLRERERLFGFDSIKKDGEFRTEEDAEKDDDVERDEEGNVVQQEVYVLDGGFNMWQEKYGEDEKVTDEYRKEFYR